LKSFFTFRFDIVAGYSAVTSFPVYATSPAVSCPNPNDLVVYDYLSTEHFTFVYPKNGSRALRGSRQQLSLAAEPYHIVLYSTAAAFLDMKLTIKNAASLATTFTHSDGNTVNTQQPVANDAVSINQYCYIVSILYNLSDLTL